MSGRAGVQVLGRRRCVVTAGVQLASDVSVADKKRAAGWGAVCFAECRAVLQYPA